MSKHGIRWDARIAATLNALNLADVPLTVPIDYNHMGEKT